MSYNPYSDAVATSIARHAEALVLGWGDTVSKRAGCSRTTASGRGCGTPPALSCATITGPQGFQNPEGLVQYPLPFAGPYGILDEHGRAPGLKCTVCPCPIAPSLHIASDWRVAGLPPDLSVHHAPSKPECLWPCGEKAFAEGVMACAVVVRLADLHRLAVRAPAWRGEVMPIACEGQWPGTTRPPTVFVAEQSSQAKENGR